LVIKIQKTAIPVKSTLPHWNTGQIHNPLTG